MDFRLFMTVSGVAACCGLRAFPTLLFVALGRIWGLWKLHPMAAFLCRNEVLMILGALALIELLVEKLKSFDAMMDMAHLFLRPLIGAFCVFALSRFTNPIHGYAFSLLIAGLVTLSVHTQKGSLKEAAPASVLRAFAPVMSLCEDGLTLTGYLLLRLWPPAAFPILVALFVVTMSMLRKWKTKLMAQYTKKATPRNPLLESGVPPLDTGAF
jgi:uncharacterized membrane protein